MLLSQRYVVKILLKEPPEVLGDFRSSALLESTLYSNVLGGRGGGRRMFEFQLCYYYNNNLFFYVIFFYVIEV